MYLLGNTSFQRVNGVLLIVLCVAIVGVGPGLRIGDGSDYYAHLVLLAEDGRPYFTQGNRAIWDEFAPQSRLFLDSDRLQKQVLTNPDGEFDTLHFWFYPALGTPFYHPLKWLNLPVGLAFNLLHVALLIAAFLTVRRNQGEWGVVALWILILSSPLVWFANKAHTEFFTVMLMIAGTSMVMARRMLGASLCFALATTQNLPMAIPAALCSLFFLYEVIRTRDWSQLWHWPNLLMAAGILLSVAVHPVYYLSRLGVLTAMIKTGHAELDRTESVTGLLNKMFCWFIDPDVGLFANWFLALPLIVLFAFLAYRRRIRLDPYLLILGGVSVLVFAYSQSRTSDFVHGGTVNMSRYGLWYLFLFYPGLVAASQSFWGYPVMARYAIGMVLVLVSTLSLYVYRPSRFEHWLEPTPIARAIYEHLPGLYDPVPQIFARRMTGNKRVPGIWAVSNESCRKILLRRPHLTYEDYSQVPKPHGCEASLDVVGTYLAAQNWFAEHPSAQEYYINLPRDSALFVNVIPGNQELLFTDIRTSDILDGGWGKPEKFGRWSVARKSALRFSVRNIRLDHKLVLSFKVRPFLHASRTSQHVTVRLNGELLGERRLTTRAPETLRYELRATSVKSVNQVIFEIENPVSPRSLGLGRDSRALGIGLISMQIGDL